MGYHKSYSTSYENEAHWNVLKDMCCRWHSPRSFHSTFMKYNNKSKRELPERKWNLKSRHNFRMWSTVYDRDIVICQYRYLLILESHAVAQYQKGNIAALSFDYFANIATKTVDCTKSVILNALVSLNPAWTRWSIRTGAVYFQCSYFSMDLFSGGCVESSRGTVK